MCVVMHEKEPFSKFGIQSGSLDFFKGRGVFLGGEGVSVASVDSAGNSSHSLEICVNQVVHKQALGKSTA